jgi:hypothetical protein
MTIQNILEIVRRAFPDVQETELLKRLDIAQKIFARQSRCLLNWVETAPADNPMIIDATLISGVRNVLFLDNTGQYLTEEELEIGWYVQDRHIHFVNTTTEDFLTVWPSSITTIRLRVIAVPDTITARTQELQIDEQFHECLMHKLMSDLYLEFAHKAPQNITIGREHLTHWVQGIARGKAYANQEANHTAVAHTFRISAGS